jgi:hypothetical protein
MSETGTTNPESEHFRATRTAIQGFKSMNYKV